MAGVGVALSNLPAQSYDSLEVRIYNQTGTDDAGVSVMGIGTGTGDTNASIFSMYYYLSTGGTVNLTNRAQAIPPLAASSPVSVLLTNLPSGTDALGTYRQMFVDYVDSGLLVFGLTANAYNNTTNNPNAVQAGDNPGDWGGVIWNQAELSYTGSIYDNIDVTAINQVGIPMLLQFMTNTTTPAPVANGTKGYTNTNNIPTMLRLLNSTPGSPWFFAAPLTNTANWLGPSTAAKPSLIMPPCKNTNYSNTVIWQAGWPGAVTPTFAPYVKAVFSNVPALGTNNGTKVFARIEDTISLANSNRTANQNSGATEYRYRFDFTLLPNPKATNLYSTPIPVLTNGVVIVVDTFANTTNTNTGLWIRYRPDEGSATNSWFSSYCYQAPSSYLNGATPPPPPNPPSGFVTWSTNWTNLAVTNNFNWYYFVANAFDKMANDIAFGVAGGFVNSPVSGSYSNRTTGLTVTTNIGAMPSYGWWAQTKLYSDLQPGSPPGYSNSYYSAYGDAIYRCSSLVYSHPISDRMTNSGLSPGLSLSLANSNSNSFLAITLLPVTVSGGPGVPGLSNNPNFIALTNPSPAWTNTAQVLQYTNTNPAAGLTIPTLTGIGASNAPLWIAADGLPPGLVFNPTNGTVSGTIPFGVSGQYLVRFQAVNSNGVGLAAMAMNVIGPPKNSGKGNVYGPKLMSNQIGTRYPSIWIDYNIAYTNSALTLVASNCAGATYSWGSNAPPGITLSNFVNAAGIPGPQIIGTLTNTNWPPPSGVTLSNWGPLPGGLTSSIVISNNYGVSTSVVILGITNSGAAVTSNVLPPSWTSPNMSGGSYTSGPVYLKLIQNQASVAGSTAPLLTGSNMANATLVDVINLPDGIGTFVSNSGGSPPKLQAFVTGTPTQTTWSYTNTNKTVNVTFVLSNNIGTSNQVVPFEVYPQTPPSSQTSPVLSWAGNAQSPVYVNQPIPNNSPSGTDYNSSPLFGAFIGGTGLWNAMWATPTNLPPGLYFTTVEQPGEEVHGAIYGIPITLTTNNVTFTVTNRYGVTTTNFSIGTFPTNLVNPSNPPYNPGPLSDVTTAPVFYGPTTASAGTNETLDWPLDVSNYPSVFGVDTVPNGLPPGLSLVAEWDDANLLFNLAVTGRPTTAGIYTSKVTAQNYWGTTTNTYTVTITGAVSDPPQFTWKTNLLVGTQSSPVLFPVRLQGSRPVSLTNSPALPLKLVLAQDPHSNWLISGTPASGGTNTVTLTASNEYGTTTTNLVLKIAWLTPPAPSFLPPYKAKGTSGVAFSFQVNAENTTNYSSADLPSGLTIDVSNGLIQGTNFGPSLVYSSTIRAIGAGGQTSRIFAFTITNTNPPPVFTSTNYVTGQVGVLFEFTNTASDTTNFSAPALPSGLGPIDGTSGVITGTPTAAGTNSWQIIASGPGGQATNDLTLAIAPVAGPVPDSFMPASALATQGLPASVQMTASNNPTNWSATGLPLNLTINASSGLISGVPQTHGTNYVTITAANSNGSGEGYGILMVYPTVPGFTSTNLVKGKQGNTLSFQVTATSSASVTYSAAGLPANLQISPAGLISGPLQTNGSITSTITASNWGTAGTQSLVFVIDTALPVFTSTNVVTGTQGVALTPFQATASNNPTNFYAQGLTPNYTFSHQGQLTGIPQTHGTSTVTFFAQNPYGTGSQSVQLRIAPAPPTPAPVITSTSAVTGTSGVAFTFQVTASHTTNYYASPLPANLTINPASGLISGTYLGPTAVTTSTVTVRGPGGTTNQQLRITMTNTNVAPVFTSGTSATGQVGVAFLFTNTATGTPTITFGDLGLPSGLGLVPATGVITGTPTAAGTNFWTITASNAGGSTRQSLSIAIANATPAPVPTSILPGSAVATQSLAFTQQMTASNNPTNWSASGLPLGLSINSSGQITGTPQTNGTNIVKITAINSNGSGEGTLNLVTRPTLPVFTSTDLVNGAQNQALQFQVTATSSANVSYTATGLPPDLTIRPDGLITGTPQANGTFSASVVASNWGNSATQALRVAIRPASFAPVITSPVTATSTQGVPFQYRIIATGSPTISYGASPLPSSLTVNATSGLISGIPRTNGVFPIQMVATNATGTNVKTLTLTIASDSTRLPVITSPTLVFGRQGTLFTGRYTITASNSPTSFSASGLPPGLGVVAASGVITGTPSINGTYISTVRASNATGIGSTNVRFIISIP